MTIKVLHISSENHFQGGETQLSYLLKMLRYQVHHEVMCIEGARLAEFCHDHDIPCHTFKGGFWGRFRLWWLLIKVGRRKRFQLFHCHDHRAHRAAWMSFLDTPFIAHRRASHKISRSPLSLMKYYSPRLKALVCPSHHVAEMVTEVVHRPDIINVIYSSIDPSVFMMHQRQGILRKELGIDEDTLLLGTLGVLRARKDLPCLIQIADIMINQGVKTHFVIIGEGPLLDQTKQLVESLGLHNHVSLLGYRRDVAAILPDLDIFVLTSKEEGFSTAVLESFAVGVPVVVSAVGGLTEIVEEDISGLLARPGHAKEFVDNILRLKDNPLLRTKLVNNAHMLLSKFESNRMAKKYKSLYQEILESENLG